MSLAPSIDALTIFPSGEPAFRLEGAHFRPGQDKMPAMQKKETAPSSFLGVVISQSSFSALRKEFSTLSLKCLIHFYEDIIS